MRTNTEPDSDRRCSVWELATCSALTTTHDTRALMCGVSPPLPRSRDPALQPSRQGMSGTSMSGTSKGGLHNDRQRLTMGHEQPTEVTP